jgi:hypothetical protein
MLYRRFATVFVLRLLWSHFQSQNWAIEKEKTSTEVLLLRFLMLFAVRGGFENGNQYATESIEWRCSMGDFSKWRYLKCQKFVTFLSHDLKNVTKDDY